MGFLISEARFYSVRRDTTRQEDGPAYRPPDGLRLSKNRDVGAPAFSLELPDAFFLFPAAVFMIPAAFCVPRRFLSLPARPDCLPGRFLDLPDGHLAFRAAILARGLPSNVPAPSSS